MSHGRQIKIKLNKPSGLRKRRPLFYALKALWNSCQFVKFVSGLRFVFLSFNSSWGVHPISHSPSAGYALTVMSKKALKRKITYEYEYKITAVS